MKKAIAVLFLAASTQVLAQFTPNSALTSSQLNAATGYTSPIPIARGGTGSATATGATSQLQYSQGSTGSATRTVTNKLQDNVSILDFGCDPTGVTYSTTCVQNAFNAGVPLWVPNGTYKIGATINIPAQTRMFGSYRFGGSANYPVFQIDAGVVGFQTPSTASGYESLGIHLSGVAFSGGATQLNVRNGGVGFTLDNVLFTGPSNYGISAAGFCQEWFFNNVEFAGGQVGFNMPNASGSGGTPSFLDKGVFQRIYAHGQSANGVVTKPLLSNQITWISPNITNTVQDGWLIDGGIRDWSIVDFATESNGYLGSAPTPFTTGSVNSGSTTLTVASASGMSVGQTLTVAGAGTNGQDLYATISSISGITITLGTAASTTVTSAEVTFYTYSDIKITNAIAQPANILIGGKVGISSSVAALRYAIDASGAAAITVVNLQSSRPVYDPNRVVTFIGNGNGLLRIPSGFLNENFQTNIFAESTGATAEAARTQLVSPSGNSIVLGLRDSLGNQTGTFGTFEVRRSDPGRTRLFYVDGQAQTVTVVNALNANGGVVLPISTVAGLPTCNTSTKGMLSAVSDATSPTYNAALTGGGAVFVPVFCNGSAWSSH